MRRRLRAEFRRELSKVLAARDAGRIDSVIVWNVNDEKRLRELASWNVDGILTDVNLNYHHIPMVFYAPKLLPEKGVVKDTVVNQVNIAPSRPPRAAYSHSASVGISFPAQAAYA